MSRHRKLAAGIALALGCALVGGSALAHPGAGGMGGMGQAGQDGCAGAAPRAMGTPQDSTAMRERMRSAGSPEERQKIAQAHRDEMHKHMAERHANMPQGMGMGMRRHGGPGGQPTPSETLKQ